MELQRPIYFFIIDKVKSDVQMLQRKISQDYRGSSAITICDNPDDCINKMSPEETNVLIVNYDDKSIWRDLYRRLHALKYNFYDIKVIGFSKKRRRRQHFEFINSGADEFFVEDKTRDFSRLRGLINKLLLDKSASDQYTVWNYRLGVAMVILLFVLLALYLFFENYK